MAHCSNDVCDAHESVVHSYAKVVHRQAVAPEDDEVSQGVSVEPDVPSYPVRNEDLLIRWHPEPVAIRCPLQYTHKGLHAQRSCGCIFKGKIRKPPPAGWENLY